MRRVGLQDRPQYSGAHQVGATEGERKVLFLGGSKMMKKMAIIFCVPWKAFFPSGLVKSNFTKPEPFNNCNTIDAVTIGPIPNDINAFRYLYQFVNLNIIKKIESSELTKKSLNSFQTAMEQVTFIKDKAVIHMGKVSDPDILVIMADFFLKFHQPVDGRFFSLRPGA